MEKYNWKEAIWVNIAKLKLVGLWPKGDSSYTLGLYTLWTIMAIFTFIYAHNFFQVVYMAFNINDLNALAATAFINLSELTGILKSYYLIQNMGILKKLMYTLTTKMFQPKNIRQKMLADESIQVWKKFYIIYWGTSAGALILWSTFPILDNTVKDFRLPFMAWYPFDFKRAPNYPLVYIYQVVSIFCVALTVLGTDTLIAALNTFIGIQFDFLCDNVLHIFDDMAVADKKLYSCIVHHKKILDFADNSNGFFNWIVFTQFFVSAVSIAITMFQMTLVVPLSSEFFSLLSFEFAIIVEIYMYCWFGNEVELKSSNVPLHAFHSNWIEAPLDLKEKLLFFLTRCQKPRKMSAFNLFYLSLDTYMKIMRTSWSYFALLQQVSSRK